MDLRQVGNYHGGSIVPARLDGTYDKFPEDLAMSKCLANNAMGGRVQPASGQRLRSASRSIAPAAFRPGPRKPLPPLVRRIEP